MKANSPNVNKEQSEAINHGAGPMLVLAGPGSGKTLVITERIKTLILDYHIRPEHILVITFTKAAAEEMQYRFVSKCDGEFYPVNFGTFHAIFFQILRQTYRFDASSILRESDKKRYMEEILEQFPDYKGGDHISMLLSEISALKNTGTPIDEYESEAYGTDFAPIYKAYKSRTREERKLDFDDMVLYCLELLQSRPKVLQTWQDRFQYILIDEFQDINPLQYQVVRLLAAPRNNLFIVGDDDQSIYGFRGSRPEIMLNFENDYPEARRVLLKTNYRSKAGIVNTAIKLIDNNEKRFKKDIVAFNQAGDGVGMFRFESRPMEIHNISMLISQYMSTEGAKYSDIAILFRTNSYTGAIAEELVRAKIPFQLKEKTTNLYDTVIGRDVVSYVRLALNPGDVKSLFKIMNKPVRYITRNSVPLVNLSRESLLAGNRDKDYVQRNIIKLYDQLDFIRRMNPYAALNYIRKGVGYEEYLEKEGLLEEGRKTLDELQTLAKGYETLEEWLHAIDHYDETIEQAKTRTDDCVSMVTMHASKGLEWKVVIIADVNEGIVPHKKAISQDEVEEERRMFYVALTRAKENLFIFYVDDNDTRNGRNGNHQPSRFINELLK